MKLEVNTDEKTILANVLANSRRAKRWVQMVPPHDGIAVLVGGGPSVRDLVGRIFDLQQHQRGKVFALNGAANFLAQHGIVPDYQVIMDAQPETASLIGPAYEYLFASQVDPECFLRVPDAILWHSTFGNRFVDEQDGFAAFEMSKGTLAPEKIGDGDEPYCLIGSSVSVGPTTLILLYALGYRTIHAFGVDCSHSEDGSESHAYRQSLNDGEPCTLERFNGKTFVCSVIMAHSARMFLERGRELERAGCEIHVHGSGYLPEMWRAPKFADTPLPVTVCCVQAGNYLGRGAEYVNTLFDMVSRNSQAMARFVCFTDDPQGLDARIEAQPLPEPGLTGWWNKLALFKRGVFGPSERVWFFDLDTLITGPLDNLFTYDGPFTLLRDFYRGGMSQYALQSSVMTWTGDECAEIWETWDARGRPTSCKGDQEWIEEFGARPVLQDLFPGAFLSYKLTEGAHPFGASVLVFHGDPRPHEVTDGWVPQVWKVGGIGAKELSGLSLSEAEKYGLMWRLPGYREYSPGEEAVPLFLALVKPEPGATVLDLACGTGRASVKLKAAGLNPILVDITTNSRDPEAMDLPFVQADLSEHIPVSAPYGYNCDMLEHVPPERVEQTIRNIMGAVETAYLNICTVHDNTGPAVLGVHLHLTVQPHGWWRSTIEKLGFQIGFDRDLGNISQFVVKRKN